MLSVLIPTFNTDVSPLVDFLLRHHDFSSFKMEIIIWDDASNIASLGQWDNENISFFKPKVTGKDIVVFTRQLSTMINAGLPLVQGIEILEKQQSNPTFKKALGEIRQDVEAGSTLADSTQRRPTPVD